MTLLISITIVSGDVRPRRLGRYCRRDQQGLVVTSAANTAQIQFTTDSSDSRTGFQINAKAGNIS